MTKTTTDSLSTIAFDDTPTREIPVKKFFRQRPVENVNKFPPSLFDRPQVSVQSIRYFPLPVEETTYLTIGGGLGSFAWVNHLVIYGVDPANITAIGFEPKPYGKYQRLCQNSQIPDHERLRSDSGATPDNIWGWPGYAVREIWGDVTQGRWLHAAKLGWQIFTEPVFAEPFTPKSKDVYNAIDREAARIGWPKIWRYGRVRAIRQTDDGRYAVAYSQSAGVQRIHKIIIAPYLHLAVGYTGLRFLPDLQRYREQTEDFMRVVNAYEDHSHVYQRLHWYGGTVLVRGRGIVASRILQRLHEERRQNPNISVLHLMRMPKPSGASYKQARRAAENHFEYQPYNFPKACFSGDLRDVLEKVDDDQIRQALVNVWGGTTTAARKEWQSIIKEGLNEGWYQIRFGQVENIHRDENDKLVITIRGRGEIQEQTQLMADYIIDATGLDAELEKNPLLKDMLQMFRLERNGLGRLKVSNNFELIGLRNNGGRVYACGAITLGGPYAPVDSFVGLQYAARQSVSDLVGQNAPQLRPLSLTRSAQQWLRWVKGVQL